jgi:hypothetical protein
MTSATFWGWEAKTAWLALIAVAVRVDIGAMVCSGSLAVDPHLETDRLAGSAGTEDEMQVAGAEPVGDAAVRLAKRCLFRTDGPGAREVPFVEAGLLDRIVAGGVGAQGFPRGEFGCALVAEIGFAGTASWSPIAAGSRACSGRRCGSPASRSTCCAPRCCDPAPRPCCRPACTVSSGSIPSRMCRTSSSCSVARHAMPGHGFRA